MREVEIRKGLKKTSIVLYDDIDQMPIERFNKANKYWMLHDNLGSTFQDIDLQHINRLMLLADNKEKLIKELENLRILIYNIINEINPNHMAFACLVHSIDGKVCDDLSEEGINRTLKKLNEIGLTEGELKKKTKEVRTKIYGDLELRYPEIFKNILSVAFWAKLKERTLKVLQGIIEDKEFTEEINAADRYFSMLIQPKSFSGKDNAELRYDKDFEKNCIILSSMANKPVKEVSTTEYFALIQHYNDQIQNGRKSNPQGRYN